MDGVCCGAMPKLILPPDPHDPPDPQASQKQLAAKPGKADKTKGAIFELLRTLARSLPGTGSGTGLFDATHAPSLVEVCDRRRGRSSDGSQCVCVLSVVL